MESLMEILRDARTTNQSYTHVLLGAPFGKVNISNSKLKEFFDCYMETVLADKHPIYLAEKPGPEIPVLVDVDLKTPGSDVKCLYSDRHVKKIIRAYQDALWNNILENPTRESMTCVLFEKPPSIIDVCGVKTIKHGFHIHFPKLFVSKSVQSAYLFPTVQESTCGLFDHLDPLCEKNGTHVDFIDEGSIKVNWLMYGSKKPNCYPYKATKCFDYNANIISLEEALGDYQLPLLAGEDKVTTCKGNVEYLLPRILSTSLHGRFQYYFKSKPSVSTPVFDFFAKQKQHRTTYEQKNIDENLKDVQELVDLISISRADDRNDWLSIGFCIWNITNGDDDGLSIWNSFSSMSLKYKEAECIDIWGKMKRNDYTIATLKYFAKIDSPTEFEQWCIGKSDALINNSIDGGHNDLAKLLFNEYHNEFVFCTQTNEWYRFEKHKWVRLGKSCSDLRCRISDDNGTIIGHFKRHLEILKEKIESLDGVVNLTAKSKSKKTSEIDLLNNKVFVLLNLIRQCKSHQFKSSVMGECAEVFRVKDFVDKLNKNPYLIAFNNGVFDLSVFKLRPGRPEDYLSTQIYLDYEDYKTKTHPDVLEIEEFFRLVFPDPDIREYFLDCVCQLFIGINKDKLILFWTGSGNNGKSVTQTLFEKMIGIDLAIKVSTTLITNKKQSLGQASPELSRTGNGVRWIVMDEPDKEETILTGLLKQLTGNDSYWARDLYQSGSQAKQIEPMYQMHLLCNTLPKIKQPDSAFWDRVRVIPFESKFLNAEDCPSTFEEQCKLNIYPKDTDLKNKFNVMLKPLAWFLLNRLKTLKAVRLVPSKVLVATSEYKEENSHDPYLEFIEECIIYDDNLIKTAITRFDMHETFSRWFLENYSSHKLPNKKIILGEFDKLLGKGKWVGTCFKKHDNDDE